MNMFGLKHAGNRDVCGETATVVSLPVQPGHTYDVDGVLAYIAHIAKGAFRGKGGLDRIHNLGTHFFCVPKLLKFG